MGNKFNNTALWLPYTYNAEGLGNGVNKAAGGLVNETRNLLSFI
jgi:hypothetical protein